MTRDEIVRADQSSGGMFAVIPSVVMADSDLPQSARMLYGAITWKCNETAYCWASNRTLGEIIGLSAKRISVLLSALEEKGHIEMEVIRDQVTGQVLQRYIYPIVKSSREQRQRSQAGAPPPPENRDTPPHPQGYPSPFPGGGIPENGKEKHKEETKHNPPYSPPAGDKPARRSRKQSNEPKEAPDWKPERFAAFWAAYPCGKSKQAAIKAWDALHASDELLDAMARGLRHALQSRQWQEGIGIPYASTWINQRRWEDEDRAVPSEDARSWADDPEVI